MKRRSRGEGSLYHWPEKNLWVAKITLPDGKRKVKYAKDQRTVREWLQAQSNQLRQGLLARDDKVTVSEYLNNYMEAVAKHTLRPKTIEAYNYLIRVHISPALGKIRLSALRPDHLQSLYAQKLESGLSKRTVQFIHSVIHKSLDQALRWGLVIRNVADLVDPPSVKRKSPTVFTPEQVHTFLNATKEDRFYPLYILAIYCGFREGELLGIHWEDISKGTITVNHAVQYQIGKGAVVTEPKTDRSRRSVIVPATALQVLNDYLKQLNKNQGLIFTTSSGKPISPRFLIKSFKVALQKAGLPNIRFHDLRHTSATLMLSANIHPKIVQERLGHSSIALTMDTYSSVLPGLQEEASEKLDRYLSMP